MKECCHRGFRSLCPLTEINRHRLPKRCLPEVKTLSILIIPIMHFLMAKSWLVLPSYAVDSSRGGAYVYSPPCILSRARCSTALSVPRSLMGNNTQLHLMGPEKQAQLSLGSDWRPTFLLKSGRSISVTAMLLSSKLKNFCTAHLPHPEVLCSVSCKYRSSASSKFHRRGADNSHITELNPRSGNGGREGILQTLTIIKLRPSGASLQSLRLVELIWK